MPETTTHDHPNAAELQYRLEQLKDGFTIRNVYDGGDIVETLDDPSAALAAMLAVDESSLRVITPEGERRSIYIILGNDPGEAVADYAEDPRIDAIAERVNAHFNPPTGAEAIRDAMTTLADYLEESHREEIDNDHHGDTGPCSYCEAIAKARALS
jgi:hypothetical protein